MTIGVNASDAISVDEDDDVQFHIPSPKLATYGVGFNFKAPLPLPDFSKTTDDAEDKEGSADESDIEDEEDPVQLTINAGVSGNITRGSRKIIVDGDDDKDVEIQVPEHPFQL